MFRRIVQLKVCVFQAFCTLIFSIALSLTPTGLVSAQSSSYTPIVESLGYRQMQAHIQSAPSGDDTVEEGVEEPLATAVVDLRQLSVLENSLNTAPSLDEPPEPVTLEEEIQTQWVSTDLTKFGYDIFLSWGDEQASTSDMPIPDSYIISSGDQVIVQLYGKVNVEYSLVVTREGQLLIPEFGPVQVAGLSFQEMRELIVSGFDRRLIGANAVVTLGEIRSIQVRVTGDVNAPGSYRINGLASMLDALLATGGIKSSGSMRGIQLKRSGELVAELDLYELLLQGDTSNDLWLRHGDTIFVPTQGRTVSIAGEVQRPAIYELKDERSVDQVLELAGGILPTASLRDSHIERIQSNRYRTLIDFSDLLDAASTAASADSAALGVGVQNGDIIRILPVANTMDDILLLHGHMKRPGGYQYKPGTYLSDLILGRDQLLPNTDLESAMIIREDSFTKRLSPVYVNLRAVLTNPRGAEDELLQPRDRIHIFDLDPGRAGRVASVVTELDRQATEYSPSSTVELIGHSRYQGRFPLQANSRLLDVLRLGGGALPGTDMNYGVIARRSFPHNELYMDSFRLGEALANPQSQANIEIYPGDRVYLFDDRMNRSQMMAADLNEIRYQSNYLDEERIVRINGLVYHSGEYPLETEMRASDLVCASGGLSLDAYGLQAELSRYEMADGEQKRLQQILLDSADLIRLCSDEQTTDDLNGKRSGELQLSQYGQFVAGSHQRRLRDIIAPVEFSSGRADISPDDISRLKAALQYYAEQDKEIRIWVLGHTDNQPLSPATAGKYGTNKGLSAHRALLVGDAILEELGPRAAEIKTFGYGATRPIASNTTSEGRARNRRVEIEFELVDLPGGSNSQPANIIGFDSSEEFSGGYFDDQKNPLLRPHDQLTFVKKPGWVEKAQVTLSGEVTLPGIYVIDRGETLCSVMKRAGGVTDEAYIFGSKLTRQSIKEMQQKTLDEIQDQLDDLLVELSMSHSAMNHEKTPSGNSKDEYIGIINQLERAEPNGRLVVDFENAMACKGRSDVALEDGDQIEIPRRPNHVNVAGQVYVATTHMWRDDRETKDYIQLSGGSTVLGREAHAFVVQANGEVMSISGKRSSSRIMNKKLQPGATVIVPLNVDRMNTTERLQSWTRSLFEAAVFAGIVF